MADDGLSRRKSKPTTVLVVDDSALVRRLLMDIIDEQSDMEVAGTARDGVEALEKVRQLDPDVVTLDLSMPRMDGISALKEIMERHPRPVVILSAFVQEGEGRTKEAMELGAVDFIPKPSLLPTAVMDVGGEAVRKIRLAAGRSHEFREAPESGGNPQDRVVVIGASAGGPPALTELLSGIPAGLPASWIVVQHMPAPFTTKLASRLDEASEMEVEEARDGSYMDRDKILVAPAGHDLVFDEGVHRQRRVRIIDTVARHSASPIIDVTMRGAARVFGNRCIGVLLSGMGTDGALGLAAIKEAGGITVVQDEASSLVFGMAKTAADRELADHVVPLEEIAGVVVDLLEAG